MTYGELSNTSCCNTMSVVFYILSIVDCKWGEWVIEQCSKSCGGGVQIDSRENIQEQMFGGKPCDGNSTRQNECNTEECPGIQIPYK